MEIQYFLPSEIARLVLGYLKEQKCLKTYQSFLKESPHLLEYISLLKAGQEYPTTIAGKNLMNMLQEYASLKLCNENKDTSNPVNVLWRQFDNVVEHLKDRQVISTRLSKGTTQTARTRCQLADLSQTKAARCSEISSVLKGKEANANIVMALSSVPSSVDCADERINSSNPVTLSRLVPDSANSDCYRESIQAVVGRSQKNVSAMGKEMASHSVNFRNSAKTAQCTGKLLQPSNEHYANFNTVVSSVLSENADLGLEKDLLSTVMKDKVSDDKRDSFDKMDNVSVCCNDPVEEDLANCDYSGKSADEVDVEVACDIPDSHDMSSPQKSLKTIIKSPLELQAKKVDFTGSSKMFTASVTNPNSLDINQSSLSETKVCRQHQPIGSQLPESDSPLQQKETGPKHFQTMSRLSHQTATGPVQIPLDTNSAQSSQTLSAIQNTQQKESSTPSVLVTPTKQHSNRNGSENFISSAKLLQSLTDAFQARRSPRRKKPPKKRISSASAGDKSATESATHIDYNSGIAGTSQEIIEKLLNDTTLHEKLAENINKGLTVLESKHSGAKSQIPKKKETSFYTSSSTLDDLFDMQESQMADDAIQGIINLTKNDSTFDSLFKLFFDDKEDDCTPVENRHSSGEITEKGHSADAEPSGFISISSSAKNDSFNPHAAPISTVCSGMLAQNPHIASNNTQEVGPGTRTPAAVSNSDSPVIVKSVLPTTNEIFNQHTQAKENVPLNSQNIGRTPVSDLSAVNSEPVQSSDSMVVKSNSVTSSSYNQHPENTSDTVTPSKTSVTMESMFSTNGNYNLVHHGHLPNSPSVCQEVTLPSTPNGQDCTLPDDSSPFSPHMTQATACLAINSDLTNSVPPVVTEVEVAYSSPVHPGLTPRQQVDTTQTISRMGGNEARTTQQSGTSHSFNKEVITSVNSSTPVSCISAPVLKSHNVGNLVLPVTKAGWIGMDPLSDASSNFVPSKSSRQVATASMNSHPSLSTATNVFGSTINLADAASILPASFPMPQPKSLISADNKDNQAQKKQKGRRIRTEKTGRNKQSSDMDTKVVSNVAASHEVVMMTSEPSNSTQALSINASDVNIINDKLIILSPGGRSLIQIPIMGYEQSAESETDSGIANGCQDNVQIWSENLQSNTQLTVISTASTINTFTTTACGTTHKNVVNLHGNMALGDNSTSRTASGSYEQLLLPTYVPEVGDDEQNLQQEIVALENAELVPKHCPETAFDVLSSETSPSKRNSSLNSPDKLIAYPLGLLCTKKKGIHVRSLDFGQSTTSCVEVLPVKQEQSKKIKTDGNKSENQVSSVAKVKPSSKDSSIEGLATVNSENDPEVVEMENEEVTTNKCRDLKQSDKEADICKLTCPAIFISKPKLVTNSNLSSEELRMPGFGRGRRNLEIEEVVVGVGKFRRTLYSRKEKQEVKEITTIDKVFPNLSTISKPVRVMPKRGATRTTSPKSGGKKTVSSDNNGSKSVPDASATEQGITIALNSSSDSSSLEICIDETEVKAQHGKRNYNKKSVKNENAIKKNTKETKKTCRRTNKGTSEEFSKTSSPSGNSSKKKSTRKNEQEGCSNISHSNSVGKDGQPSKSKRRSLFEKTNECSSAGKKNDLSDSEKKIVGQPLKEPKEAGEDEENKTQMNCKTLPSPPKSKSKRRTSKPDSDKDSTLTPKSSSLSNSCKAWKVSLKTPGTSRSNKGVKSKDSTNNRNRKKLDETAKSSSDNSDLQVLDNKLRTRTVKQNSDKVLKSKKASEDKNLHAESLVADFVQLKESVKKCKESEHITSPCSNELRVVLTPDVRIHRDNSNMDDKEENKVKRNSFEKVKAVDIKEIREHLENIPLEQGNVTKENNKETYHISEEEIENACRSISESPLPNQNDDTLSISSNVLHVDEHRSEISESVFETSHHRKGLSTSTPKKQIFESVKTSTPNSSSSGSDETPRKCEVLEKLGLTPKKNECEKPWELNSSQRPNVMDLIITQPSPSTKGSIPSEVKTPAKIKTPRKRVTTPHKVLSSPMTKLKSPLQSMHVSPERNHSTFSLGEYLTKENQQEPQNAEHRGQKRSFGEALKQCDLQPSKKVKQPKKEKKPDVMSKLQSLDIDAFLSKVHNQGQS
ncbi:hypothetical protein CHS0354_007427 [Potamilus streckersoni]|uniref:LisH domain-containing protein n=1 Tax=Potamilus streckersoni TaxID=2493646 RepID=A0AAE0SWG9_9BIVA|nr:hypothetical protein CHS0354_007427 [Potamilus streckersoni]